MNCLSKLNNKTIGIIGIGYIGKHLFNFLLREKQKRNITLLTFNRDNLQELEQYQFDYFFNCTGNTGDFRTQQRATIESNIVLTSYLLEKVKVKENYLALSSTRIYGFSKNKGQIFTEDDFEEASHLNIDYIYNGSKKLMESLLMNVNSRNACRYTVIRPSNVIGNFELSDLNNETLFKVMLKNSLHNETLNINQHESSSKDYIHVYDLVIGIIQAAVLTVQSDIFNIAYGHSFSLKEMSNLLNLDVTFDNSKVANYSQISIEKAKNSLGFEPSIKIETLSRKKIMDLI